jgi:uncharacterized protein YbjT (DUF2867 family)
MEMNTNRKAIVAGGTGLVGQSLLKLLLDNDKYSSVQALGRRDTGLVHPKLKYVLSDFEDADSLKDMISGDDVFCCLGTTMKKAGSKEAFYRVDHDYVINLAKAAISKGAQRFFLVSALGADKKSMIFYNRVKGEVERDLSELGFDTLCIFRPSLLLGDRKEQRAGEDIAKSVYKVINPLLPAKYKGIQASVVAAAMLSSALNFSPGKHIIFSGDIQNIAAFYSETA